MLTLFYAGSFDDYFHRVISLFHQASISFGRIYLWVVVSGRRMFYKFNCLNVIRFWYENSTKKERAGEIHFAIGAVQCTSC